MTSLDSIAFYTIDVAIFVLVIAIYATLRRIEHNTRHRAERPSWRTIR